MRKQTTCYICDKPLEPEWLPEGEFTICDECSSDTDEISVEKLQRENEIMKKALTEIAYGEYNTFKLSAVPIAKQALAALEGGEDE